MRGKIIIGCYDSPVAFSRLVNNLNILSLRKSCVLGMNRSQTTILKDG